MKIHEYNQMMAYLTRPAVPGPSSENPGPRITDREPYYMGGRVGFKRGTTIGRPEASSTRQVKNFLNNLKKGSTVNRTNLIQKFNVDPSLLTKILKEYEDKNFTFEKSPSALKGSIINKPTKAQAELSEFLFGKKWN